MSNNRNDGSVTRRVRLLFAHEGTFHNEVISVPAEALERHERLIDCLLEDPDVLRYVHVDAVRLCSAAMEPDAPAMEPDKPT